jgi:hypothetical protein
MAHQKVYEPTGLNKSSLNLNSRNFKPKADLNKTTINAEKLSDRGADFDSSFVSAGNTTFIHKNPESLLPKSDDKNSKFHNRKLFSDFGNILNFTSEVKFYF